MHARIKLGASSLEYQTWSHSMHEFVVTGHFLSSVVNEFGDQAVAHAFVICGERVLGSGRCTYFFMCGEWVWGPNGCTCFCHLRWMNLGIKLVHLHLSFLVNVFGDQAVARGFVICVYHFLYMSHFICFCSLVSQVSSVLSLVQLRPLWYLSISILSI